jgi:hypothetical protein
MNKTGCGASIEVEVQKRNRVGINSIWDVVCHDKDGKEKWHEVRENLVTNQGLQTLLDVMFLAGTQIVVADWLVALTESGSSATASSTYAVPVYTECTSYTGNRKAYVGVRSAQTITNNASKAVFTINATKSLLGGALVGGAAAGLDTPGNTAGAGCILYCSIDFSALKPVVDTDVVSITITLTAADA